MDPWLSVKLTNFKTNPASKVSYVERTIFEFNSKDGNRKYLIELWDYKGKVKQLRHILPVSVILSNLKKEQ